MPIVLGPVAEDAPASVPTAGGTVADPWRAAYLRDCRHVQKGTFDVQTLVGQIWKRIRDRKQEDGPAQCVNLALDAASRLIDLHALLGQVQARLTEVQAPAERNNSDLMYRKLGEALLTTAGVLVHILGLLTADCRDGTLEATSPGTGGEVDGGAAPEAAAELERMRGDLAAAVCELQAGLDGTPPLNDAIDTEHSWEDFDCSARLPEECALTTGVSVTEHPAATSAAVVELPAGTRVTVLEVLFDRKEERVRGRIREACGYDGFITLRDQRRSGMTVRRLAGASGESKVDIFETTQQLASHAISFVANRMPHQETTQQLASQAISLVASTMTHEAKKLPPMSIDDYSIGEYLVIREVMVNETPSVHSKRINMLPPGARVSVLEVVFVEDEARVRGRFIDLAGCPGFLTLRTAEHVFVRRVEDNGKPDRSNADRAEGDAAASVASKGVVPGEDKKRNVFQAVNPMKADFFLATQKLASSVVAATMPDAPSKQELSKLPDSVVDEYHVGEFVLLRDAALTEALAFDSRRIAVLPGGTSISVLDVTIVLENNRVRARASVPTHGTGFLTLRAGEQIFARRVQRAAPTDELSCEGAK
mmetsp:Transcript_90795/g.256417  ORF Transcript_90795/g.256417 Transcript_90795/m.256417 type:complete len:594 (+) Transcript_90795:37-1818(+)